MNYSVVSEKRHHIIGIACKTVNFGPNAMQGISELWGRFYGENVLSQIPNRSSDDIIALYCDYEGDYTKPYLLVIGCAVSSIDQVPEGMVARSLPASNYARFTATGEMPKGIIETWLAIWQADLPRTYTGDFQIHRQGAPEVQILVAIKER